MSTGVTVAAPWLMGRAIDEAIDGAVRSPGAGEEGDAVVVRARPRADPTAHDLPDGHGPAAGGGGDAAQARRVEMRLQ